MQKTKITADNPNFLERRAVGFALSAILFATNFLLFYFIWILVFKDITGFVRLAMCWVGAYALTWVMSCLAKGTVRLVLALLFLGLLYIVFMCRPYS